MGKKCGAGRISGSRRPQPAPLERGTQVRHNGVLRIRPQRLLTSTLLAIVASLALAAGASALSAHGQLLKLAPGTRAHTNQSQNWFGYNQGTLEQGSKLFNSITGDWTVPTASQHTKGQDEYSSDWIGIGGGCVDANCNIGDTTLIQTGTEQDVASNGKASYSAWWELIPAPSLTITNMTVRPGDKMHASIAQTTP